MKATKTVYIDTGLFSIQFNWNGKVVGLHTGVFVGLTALTIITREMPIHKLCVTFFVIELLVLLVLLFRGFNMYVEDGSEAPAKEPNKNKEPQKKESLDVEVDRTKKSEKSETKPNNKKEEVINNKVPIPNAPAQPKVEAPATETTPAAEEPPTADKDKVIDDLTAKFCNQEMTEEDWDALFNS